MEFIGQLSTRHGSEIHPPSGPLLDVGFVRRFAAAHEEAGFDRVLIGHSASSPDGMQVAAALAASTERLGFLIAHRPGFVAPTLAARSFATLDAFAGPGRVAVHTISGGSDADQARDGDHLDKEGRYRRTDEYLEVLRRTWEAGEPFDHHGEFYDVDDAQTDVRPEQPIPVFFGGSSESAYRVGGKHADVFALWGEPLAETAEQIASVHAAARAAGRSDLPGISVSFRPILGATEEQAWDRAHDVLDRIVAAGGGGGSFTGRSAHRQGHETTRTNVGSQRLMAAAERGELHDRCLWTPTAAASGAAGNSTALVGTPETVAAALLDYVDLGVTTFLLRGYDPFDDVAAYGRDLLPLVRSEVASRGSAA
ncbi:LLM class flavin-dependent oxidoreductase [Actinomycetospora soli]|uniref:LLM class flavin-dependent oxidoreductase n=1 Tax=Actinomycetospora soli TaxID=2893887 RepID=UPI001E2BBBB3|nr:LLM class flavin-dependent oxidoreductase [Actinomycetospora soli]MCD2186699.1 LLM class flavin-dependent oxidoreductase [Actinomycetospora soli]